MRKNDKLFAIVIMLTTFIALALHFFLSLSAKKYAKNIAASTVDEVSKSPFIMIDLLKGGVWVIYIIVIVVLIVKWWAKRVKE